MNKPLADIIVDLEHRFNGVILSTYKAGGGDVDCFVSPSEFSTVTQYLRAEEFVVSHITGTRLFAFRFTQGTLEMFDIFSDLTFIVGNFASHITPAGQQYLLEHLDVLRFVKYLLQFRHEPRHLAILEQFAKEGLAFLGDSDFVHPYPFKKVMHQKDIVSLARRQTLVLLKYLPLRTWLRMLTSRFLRRRPKGVSIAIIGADGAGKSTVIEALAVLPGISVRYMGDQQFYLQAVFDWLVRQPLVFARGVYLGIMLGQYLRAIKVWWLCRSGITVILDRYPGYNGTALCDKPWYHPQHFLSIYYPKPDYMVLLYASPELIHSRKQELSIPEIEHVQQCFKERMRARVRACEIENIALDTTLNEICALAYEKL